MLHFRITHLRLVLQNGMTAGCFGVRVQLHHYSEILQWVLLENPTLNLFATDYKYKLDTQVKPEANGLKL